MVQTIGIYAIDIIMERSDGINYSPSRVPLLVP